MPHAKRQLKSVAEKRGDALEQLRHRGYLGPHLLSLLIKVPAFTITTWLEHGQMHGIMLNGRWRIQQAEIERYQQEGLRDPTAVTY